MVVKLIGIIIGLVQLLISLFFGIFYIFAAYVFFKKMTTKIDDTKELKENNIALAIFMGAVLFSVVWISRYAIVAGMQGISGVIINPKTTVLLNYAITIGILLLQVILSGLIAFFSIWLAVKIFLLLTRKIDEMAEIKNNNIAIAIIVAVLIIGISLFIEPAIKEILNGLIPIPEQIMPRM